MKKFVLLFAVLLICGCSSEYNLIIDSSSVSESVSITLPKDEVSVDEFESQINYSRSVYDDNLSFYNMDRKEDSDNYYINYSYKHSYGRFADSNFLKLCFSDVSFTTDKNITFKTGNRFNCIQMSDGSYFDEVKVNIKTNLKVLKDNADVKDGNSYTWIFNESNYLNKPIILSLDKSSSSGLELEDFPILSIIIFLFVLILVILSILLFVKYRSRNSNDFDG